MAGSRHRSGPYGTGAGGTATGLASGVSSFTQGSYDQSWRDCWDTVGFPNESNPFALQRWNNPLGWTTGRIGWAYEVENFYNIHSVWPNTAGTFSTAVAATKALAGTNPSRPHLDVWAFLGELKDLPNMVRNIGGYLSKISKAQRLGRVYVPTAKDVAEGYINYIWGWKLLVQDLLAMFDFTEAVEKRAQELSRLYSDKGLKRRYTVARGVTKSYPYNLYTPSLYSAAFYNQFQDETEYHQWVTLRWRTSDTLPWKNSDERRHMARSLVFGHKAHIDTVWELVPWSWLVDWFTTTGDFLRASRNTLNASSYDVNVMTQYTTRIRHLKELNNPWGATLTMSKYPGASSKNRDPYYGGPVVQAYLPIVSDRQLSILGALSVLRM